MKKQLISLLFWGLAFVAQAQTVNVPYINIERYRNATVEMIFVVKNNSAIQNLSGTELRFRIINGANYAVDSSTRTLGGVTNLDSARIRVLFSPAQITRLRGDVYNYEFLKIVNGTKTMLCTGQFRLILNPAASGAPPANIIVINIGTGTASSTNTGTITTPANELDPTVPLWVKGITQTNLSNFNTAYGWGNHASAGYLLGAGTPDYIPKFSGVSGIIASPLFVGYGNNIGIGTQNPTAKFGIKGNGRLFETYSAGETNPNFQITVGPDSVTTNYNTYWSGTGWQVTKGGRIGYQIKNAGGKLSFMTSELTMFDYDPANLSEAMSLEQTTLNVKGLKIANGTQGTGKFLKSDQFGTAIWESVSIPANTSDLNNDAGFLDFSTASNNFLPVSYAPTWSQVTSKPTFATVATTGSYNDLSNKPTIPTVQDTTVLLRKTTAAATYQPKGNYQPLGNYQKVYEIDQPDGIFTNMVIRNTTSGEILRLWIGGDTTDTGPNKYKMYVIKGTFSGVNDWRMFDVEGARYLDENLYGITQIDSSTTQVINSVTYRVYIQKFAISKISLGDQDSAGTGRRLIFNYPTNWVFTEQKRWKKKI